MKLTYEQIQKDVHTLSKKINKDDYTSIYAVPRGGVPIAALLSSHTGLPLVDAPEEDSLIVDDMIDSGKTHEALEEFDWAVLYVRDHTPKYENVTYVDVVDEWVEFPWESTTEDAEENFRRILQYLGEDTTREGLLDTPKRYIKFMKQFLTVDDFNFTTFENEGGNDEMIIQRDIPFFSLCEHHTAPFFGHATVAYIPGEKIVGLSKLARTVALYSHRFQNQERITSQVAERLQEELGAQGVAVTLSARHFCMEMRGVKTHDVHTVTTKLTGAFKDDPKTRAEYMSHVQS